MYLERHHSRSLNLKFQQNWSDRLDVGSNFVNRSHLYFYCVSLIMVNHNYGPFLQFTIFFVFNSVSYEQGRQKTRLAEETSDLQTDNEMDSGQRKTRK